MASNLSRFQLSEEKRLTFAPLLDRLEPLDDIPRQSLAGLSPELHLYVLKLLQARQP